MNDDPPPQTAVDNDILIKAFGYGLAQSIWPEPAIGVLGAARYVVGSRLRRLALSDPDSAVATFDAMLVGAVVLEPTEQELLVAAEIERAAQRDALALDTGESQLAAIVMERGINVIQMGDKRAIAALQSLRGRADELERLDGRITCLEQILRTIAPDETTGREIGRAVCSAPDVDKSLGFCFSCAAPEPPPWSHVVEGLESYINDVRTRAPDLLSP